MAVERLNLDNNPGASATHTFGRQGVPPGITYTSEGDFTIGGNLTVVGSVTAGSGLGAANNPFGHASESMSIWGGVSTRYALNAGTQVMVLAPPLAAAATRIGTWLTDAGITSTGSNRLAVYSLAGVLLATSADMTALMAAAGDTVIEALLDTPVGPTSDPVYLSALTHFTTAPKVAGSVDLSAIASPIPPFHGRYPSVFTTGQTSPVASFDPSLISQNTAAYYLYVR